MKNFKEHFNVFLVISFSLEMEFSRIFVLFQSLKIVTRLLNPVRVINLCSGIWSVTLKRMKLKTGTICFEVPIAKT